MGPPLRSSRSIRNVLRSMSSTRAGTQVGCWTTVLTVIRGPSYRLSMRVGILRLLQTVLLVGGGAAGGLAEPDPAGGAGADTGGLVAVADDLPGIRRGASGGDLTGGGGDERLTERGVRRVGHAGDTAADHDGHGDGCGRGR